MFDCRLILVAGRRRARAFAAMGIAGSLLVTLSGSAEAQFFGWFTPPPPPYSSRPQRAMISPGDIYRIVADHGYRVRGRLKRNGRVYLADVVDQSGRRLRLVIDAYEGNIVQRFATAPPRPVASIPQRIATDLYPQYSAYPAYPGYPSYPDGAPPPAAAAQPRVVPRDAGRSHVRKKQMAARETTPRRVGHPARPETVAPRPAAQVEPATAAAPAKAAAKVEPVTAAVTPAPPASSPKPAPPKTNGPGYANGVPINPLD